MLSIAEKANKILHILLIVFALIVVRLWLLSVVQSDKIREEARKPQQRVLLEMAPRGTIRDRFNIPLAINKMGYQVALIYSQIAELPSVVWEKDETGKKVKRYKRKEHIQGLSSLLGEELDMDPSRILDLIYSKAALYHQRPFILKESITEKQYYRLKMLEREWPGLQVMKVARRSYPKGRVGADIIGYMGAINRQEYEAIIGEINCLEEYLKEWNEGNNPPLPENIESSQQARDRLRDLQEKAYTINDWVGKAGIEYAFEELLRGFHGKTRMTVDAKGSFLRELPGSQPPTSGHRVLLTISAELQEYIEKLLIQNERIRDGRCTHLDRAKGTRTALREPWVKGGAIVVLDPQQGEILAMASHPRYDPNDFVGDDKEVKISKLRRWMESESYLADLWDQKLNLERESSIGGVVYDESVKLSWNYFLDQVLSQDGDLRKAMNKVCTLKQAVQLQRLVCKSIEENPSDIFSFMNSLYPDEPHRPYGKGLGPTLINSGELRKKFEPFFASIPSNYDKVLMIDLCRLAVCETRFSDELLKAVGERSLEDYRLQGACFYFLENIIKGMSKELFHEIDFKNWRAKNEKIFLKLKREEEKAKKKYSRPYTDYLDKEEQAQFQTFWEVHRWKFIATFLNKEFLFYDETLKPYLDHFSIWATELGQGAHLKMPWRDSYDVVKSSIKGLEGSLAIDYLKTIRSYQDLVRPLWGRYSHLRNEKGFQLEKHLASAFYPLHGMGYFRSNAYRQATTQGSIFKLVTAYEAMIQRYFSLQQSGKTTLSLNPLEINDFVKYEGGKWQVGEFIDGRPIPRLYKGGLLPRTAQNNAGRVDIVKALEISSNPYFSLLASDFLEDPDDLVDAARQFGYGAKTGIELQGELAGHLPEDLSHNKTGLYTFAIGQHDLVVTPLQTAVMIAAIANGGKILRPHVVKLTAGKDPSRNDLVNYIDHFKFKDELSLIGVDFPLFSAAEFMQQTKEIKVKEREEVRELFMPEEIRKILLQGMERAFLHTQTVGQGTLTWIYRKHPEAIKDFTEMKNQLIGKTSTSEVVETLDLDLDHGTNTYSHIWFGGISFERTGDDSLRFIAKDPYGKPELVVVVYLKFGGFGKESMPIAAQIVKKWREIKKSRSYTISGK